jgi:HAD superfamily hydrolase (TIGR01509 family)
MLDLSRFQAVIFDVDGTLYDQRTLRKRMALRMVSAYWMRPASGFRAARALQAYRRAQEELRGEVFSATAQVERAARTLGYPADEIRALAERWMERSPLDLLAGSMYPGLADLLKTLTSQGIRCAIFSDYPAEEKLTAMGIRHFFDPVVCAQEVERLKPDPRGILKVIATLGVAPHEALYIGDREIDEHAAKRAGIEAILVRGPDAYTVLRKRFGSVC